jgi:hypothetical protein
MNGKVSIRAAVLAALRTSSEPIDGYAVAKITGVSPLQASRALERLVRDGHALKQDTIDGLLDPSATFQSIA